MADKTKAVALNRQCGYEYRKTIPFDLTRAISGGQILNRAIASVRLPEIEGELCGGCTAVQHTSFRVAKMQLGTFPQLWGSQDYKYQSLSASLAFLRCRRLISPFAAVTRNPAVLSPSSRSRSISSITSWGILTVVICDLAFFAPVAITETPCVRCISVYVKKIRRKVLRCISLWARFKRRGDIHLESAKPGGARNTHRASNQNSYVR